MHASFNPVVHTASITKMSIIYLLHHLLELFFLIFPQLPVVFNISDINVMLGLWLRGLKWTG